MKNFLINHGNLTATLILLVLASLQLAGYIPVVTITIPIILALILIDTGLAIPSLFSQIKSIYKSIKEKNSNG